MSVLVTGGAGYIGSHMVWALLDANEDVVVIDDLSTGIRNAIPQDVAVTIGSIGDADLVQNAIYQNNVTAIAHFAGSVVVPDSIRDPIGYYQNNTANSLVLIEAAVKLGVRNFVFSSSAAVYGTKNKSPVKETAPTVPISPYGNSKLMTEIMLADISRAHDFNYIALRYFNVAGADEKGRTGQSTRNATHLIKAAAQAALGKRESLQVFGSDYETLDGTCIRDYIHVSDLIASHMSALEHLRNGGGSQVLNCGYGKGYSVLEIIETMKRVSNSNFAVEFVDRRKGDPANLVANADCLSTELKWKPQHDSLDKIALSALKWEKQL